MELTKVQRWLIAGSLGVAVAVVGVVVARRSGAAQGERIVVQNTAPAPVASTTAQAGGVVAVHVVGGVRSPGVYRLRAGARVADAVDAAGGVLPGVRPEWINLAAPLEDGQQVYVPASPEAAPASPTLAPVVVPDPSVPGASVQTVPDPTSAGVVTRSQAAASPDTQPAGTGTRTQSQSRSASQAATPARAPATATGSATTPRAPAASHHNFRYPINVNSATEAELDVLPHIGPAMAARIIQHRNSQGPFHNLEELGQVKGIGTKTLADLAPYVAF